MIVGVGLLSFGGTLGVPQRIYRGPIGAELIRHVGSSKMYENSLFSTKNSIYTYIFSGQI